MNLYDILANNQVPTLFSKSQEQIYYNENSYRLNELESYSYLANPNDSFGIIRGNIILRALENKERIEALFKTYKKSTNKTQISVYEYMKSGLATLPYLLFNNAKVYVPVFPLTVASIYGERFERLGEMPYKRILKQYESALIDPFDYYGYEIFISYFTRLILIKKNDCCAAFYDYDAKAIYIINNEGRLDNKICLFDKYLAKPNLSHLMPRVSAVVEAYFENDRDKMLKMLYEGGLISQMTLDQINKNIEKKSKLVDKRKI